MNLLAEVTTGKIIGPQVNVIAGQNGVGKTTWATSFTDTLIADLENGARHIDGVTRLSRDILKDLATFRGLISELMNTNHKYKSLAVDSAEALEGLISDAVCKEGQGVSSLEEYGGGFGKGHARTREIMREIMFDFQRLRDVKGMTVNLVAHTQVKTISDPATNQSYDRVIMRCNDKMAAIIRDLADNVFYATYKVFTDKQNGKVRAYGDGQRVMYTQWRPGFDAKNRLDLPLELPLSYDAFMDACGQGPQVNLEEILADIKEMSSKVSDDKLKASVSEQIEKFKTNPTKLKEIKNRLMKYVA